MFTDKFKENVEKETSLIRERVEWLIQFMRELAAADDPSAAMDRLISAASTRELQQVRETCQLLGAYVPALTMILMGRPDNDAVAVQARRENASAILEALMQKDIPLD